MNNLHKLIANSKKLMLENPELRTRHGLNNSGFKFVRDTTTHFYVIGIIDAGFPLGTTCVKLGEISLISMFTKFHRYVFQEKIIGLVRNFENLFVPHYTALGQASGIKRTGLCSVVHFDFLPTFYLRDLKAVEAQKKFLCIDELSDFRGLAQSMAKGKLTGDEFKALDWKIEEKPKSKPMPFWANNWRKKGKRK